MAKKILQELLKAPQKRCFAEFYFLLRILYAPMHTNSEEANDVKCLETMAGIQWERCALHTWQEEGKEQHRES